MRSKKVTGCERLDVRMRQKKRPGREEEEGGKMYEFWYTPRESAFVNPQGSTNKNYTYVHTLHIHIKKNLNY